MTVLDVLRDVSLFIGLTRPTTVFASTSREHLELQAIVNEAARTIARAHDWQRLRAVCTLTGNGASEAFDLPANYGRMLKTANLWSSRYRWDMTHVVDTDEWLALDVVPLPAFCGLWTLYGNQIHLRPIMTASETVKFFYVRNTIVSGDVTLFTADAQTFVLDDRLLKLCTVYLWKQQKGQDFAAELADFEMALMQEIDTDGGSKPVLSGNTMARRPAFGNVWPGKVIG